MDEWMKSIKATTNVEVDNENFSLTLILALTGDKEL